MIEVTPVEKPKKIPLVTSKKVKRSEKMYKHISKELQSKFDFSTVLEKETAKAIDPVKLIARTLDAEMEYRQTNGSDDLSRKTHTIQEDIDYLERHASDYRFLITHMKKYRNLLESCYETLLYMHDTNPSCNSNYSKSPESKMVEECLTELRSFLVK